MKRPEGEYPGVYPTLNKMGFHFAEAIKDPFTAEFIHESRGQEVLEIGAAYGEVVKAALVRGAKRVWANDLDERHLEILSEDIPSPSDKTRLRLAPGKFPELDFVAGSFDSIHCARVIHFLQTAEIEQAFSALFRWLRPGGKVFVVAPTPYYGNTTEFAPRFEKRKEKGERWPGEFVTERDLPDAKLQAALPERMVLFDEDLLRAELERVGFKVERVSFFRPVSERWNQLDGREHVGACAVKPG